MAILQVVSTKLKRKINHKSSASGLVWHKKELVNLKLGQLRWSSLRNKKKKNKEKWTEPQRPVGWHKVYKHIHNGIKRK